MKLFEFHAVLVCTDFSTTEDKFLHSRGRQLVRYHHFEILCGRFDFQVVHQGEAAVVIRYFRQCHFPTASATHE